MLASDEGTTMSRWQRHAGSVGGAATARRVVERLGGRMVRCSDYGGRTARPSARASTHLLSLCDRGHGLAGGSDGLRLVDAVAGHAGAWAALVTSGALDFELVLFSHAVGSGCAVAAEE